MKVLLLSIAVTMMTCNVARAEWLEIHRTDNFTLHYSTEDTVKRKDGLTESVVKWHYSEQQNEGGSLYSYSLENILIDCSGNKITIQDVHYFNNNNVNVLSKKINKTITSGKVAEKIVGTVCKYANSHSQKSSKSMGTGFVVNKSGHIVTCNHVIDGRKKVYCLNGSQEIACDIIKVDEKNDIALLKMRDKIIPHVLFRNGKSIKPGENCVVLGFPLQGLLAQEVNVTTGTVSASSGPGNDIRFIQTTASIHPGNSGGPLFDMYGEVAGLVVFKLNAIKLAQYTGDVSQNLGFALNSIIVKLFLDANGIEYEDGHHADKLEPSSVFENNRNSVVLIVSE